MTTNNADQIQAQIQRFETMKRESTDATFADKVLVENTERGLQETFEAILVDDPCIEAIADIHPRGGIDSILICVNEGGERAQFMHVAPGSGLWRAMEVWLDDFRATWTED